MKKIIIENPQAEYIHLNDVSYGTPIFVKKDGKLKGMVIKDDSGWIISLGADYGALGYSDERADCLRKGLKYNYEYYVED